MKFKFNLIAFLLVIGLFSISSKSAETCSPQKGSGAKALEPLSNALNSDLKKKCQEHPDYQFVTSKTFGILSASGIIEDMVTLADDKIKQTQKQIQTQGAKPCPEGCQKVDEPSYQISTEPTERIQNPKCPNKPELITLNNAEARQFEINWNQGFSKSFNHNSSDNGDNCQKSVEDFIADTLQENNSLGQFLRQQKCSNDCSVSLSAEVKKTIQASQCNYALNMRIFCGQPRAKLEWKATAHAKPFKCQWAGANE